MSGINAILRINSNVTQVCNLRGIVTDRLLRFRSNAINVTLGLRRSGMNTILVNSNVGVHRNDPMSTANGVTSMPINSTVLNHMISTLTHPVSNGNSVTTARAHLVRSPTPNVVTQGSICRPVRAKVATVSTVVPVKQNRHRLVVNSHRANGATVTVSAVLGRGSRSIIYICITMNRGTTSITRIISILQRHNTLSCAVIITTGTGSPTPLRCLTPCANTTLTRCFVCRNGTALIICSSLAGRTRTCHRVSLLLHHPPNQRTCPNSIFCLRSHLLRQTTGLDPRLNRNDVATLPVVRARTNSMSTCVPAGMVSVASNRVFLSSSLFGSNLHPTVGTNVSISQINSTTRVGTVGRITNGIGLRLTRFSRLRTFSRFTSSLSTSARGRLTQNRHLQRLLGRPRCSPLPIRRRITVVCTKVGNCVSRVPTSRIITFTGSVHSCVHGGGPGCTRLIHDRGGLNSRDRTLLGTNVGRTGRTFVTTT